MAIIFVPGTIHQYLKLRQTETNIMAIICVPALLNEMKITEVRANIMVIMSVHN